LAAILSATPLFAQPNFETPKAVALDAESQKQIAAKTEQLRKAVAAIPAASPDVEVYLKAAEWATRHGEFFAKDSAKQTLTVLDAGLARAKAAAGGKAPWRDVRGKPVVRAYRSKIDGSVQPYSVLLPDGFGTGDKKWRLDVVLHGRDQTLSEVKFLNGKETAKGGSKTDRVVLEIYGRGNNAYRWAGEQDVFEAVGHFLGEEKGRIDESRVVLRGFSMGGAGTWHIGLHHPSKFVAISPGAGFTTTHGYIKNLPTLPDHQERCLKIYDAVNYAENVFNVPVVAYSGEKDPQKAAADNIENALKEFKESLRFTHLVAPGLEHKQPPEWLAKVETEFEKYLKDGRPKVAPRVRFVTYTLRYPTCDWVTIDGLERHYEKAVVDAELKDKQVVVSTKNVSRLTLNLPKEVGVSGVVIDGKQLAGTSFTKGGHGWAVAKDAGGLRKSPGLQGPIDDVFHTPFRVVGPTGDGWAKAAFDRFGYEWDKFFRGTLPVGEKAGHSAILFGTPDTNPAIKAVLPKLPIAWTAEKLVVNGVEYDAKTHVPAMIYPHPAVPGRYVVLNSGHTFHAAELKGTNAQLYPRLGDWAVLKPSPTKADPAAAEVVAAGIFDENWQFAK
jgi:hypothetical protein